MASCRKSWIATAASSDRGGRLMTMQWLLLMSDSRVSMARSFGFRGRSGGPLRLARRPLGGFAGGAFFGLFEPVALAFEDRDFGAMHQPVDQRDDAGGVREDLAPFAERLVGREDQRTLLISAGDDLKQQVRIARIVGQVPDLIDREDFRGDIPGQTPRERARGVLLGKIREHVRGPHEARGMALQ